jgi:hypothetical protein
LVEYAALLLAVVVNPIWSIPATAELRICGLSILYSKEEYVNLLQGEFGNMFPKCIKVANDETSLVEELLQENAQYSSRIQSVADFPYFLRWTIIALT